MPYNPRTFDLGSRFKHGELLERCYNALQEEEVDQSVGVVIPCASKNDALTLSFALNRWRKAYRVQNEDSRYDDLVISVNEDTLVVKDRSENIPDYTVINPVTGQEY